MNTDKYGFFSRREARLITYWVSYSNVKTKCRFIFEIMILQKYPMTQKW
ncbi:MAG: hypothetical protein JETT_1203 [Candidatus Jettenia ecosi]|uniref:Uncharacterized protein n=1 Tax=Candidatus Jettenia ecosi TaxID=2494326 RepID=A0A533QPF8_9BACT|nr:MAG: hypothetical protein JETT_1203 [Candidatus Jettenia ecosi]